jgi:ribosomal protein S12 methylthiotransferase
VPEEVKQERLARFMEVQAGISREKLREKVGRTMQVIVDAVERGTAIARSAADAPEIDGIVRVRKAKGAKVGDFLAVKIKSSTSHDLDADVLLDEAPNPCRADPSHA